MTTDDDPRPDGLDRLAVYALSRTGFRRRIAETSLEGLGLTLLTLEEEGEFHAGLNEVALRVGIFDRLTRRWLISPWAKAPKLGGAE